METINLHRNENNYGPAPACYDVLKMSDKKLFYYYSQAYKEGIKSILSKRLADDFNVDEKRVILGYGAEDILKQLVQCYLGPGQKLMIPSFSWWYYKKIADEVGGTNVEYPLSKGKDSFYYDVDKILSIIKEEKPKLVLISSPNNPTGNSLPTEDLDLILTELKDTVVALDEAYWSSKNDQHVTNLVNKFPNLVVIRSFSKYYALAGIRIGYAIIGENLTKLAGIANRYLGFNQLSEEIAMAALDSPEYYEDLVSKMNADKESYYKELGALPGFNVFKSNANFVLVEVPKKIMEPLKEFLTKRGIIIKFMNEEILNSHLRITIGTQEQNRKVIDAIKEFAS